MANFRAFVDFPDGRTVVRTVKGEYVVVGKIVDNYYCKPKRGRWIVIDKGLTFRRSSYAHAEAERLSKTALYGDVRVIIARPLTTEPKADAGGVE